MNGIYVYLLAIIENENSINEVLHHFGKVICVICIILLRQLIRIDREKSFEPDKYLKKSRNPTKLLAGT